MSGFKPFISSAPAGSENAKTGHGELATESLTPVVQVSASHGLLNSVLSVIDNGGSGTASVVGNMFTCDSGTAANGISSIATTRHISCRAGQGMLARFSCVYDTPISGNIQAAGLLTAEDTLTFNYINTNFGISYGHDGKDELQELTLTVAAGSETATVTIDGIGYSVILSGLGTVQEDAFEIAESLTAQVPNYDFSSNNDQVVAQSVIPATQSAFSYSSAGTSVGSFVQLVAGQAAIQDFFPQSAWNKNTMPSLDTSKGNEYQIQSECAGFGTINFFILDGLTGSYTLVHALSFSNVGVTPSISNPTFRLGWASVNIGATTSVRVQGASAGAFIEGIIVSDSSPRSSENEQLAVTTSLTNILSVRNRISFGGKVNRADILPRLISAASQTNKAAFFKIIINPVFASPVIFNYIDKDNSISEVATDNALVSGGTEIGSIIVTNAGTIIRAFDADQVTPVPPGSILCLAAQMSSGAASDCQGSTSWQEDL